MNTTKFTYWEILSFANSQSTPKERIAALHQFSEANLKTLLDYAFNPNIKWLIPEGTPPFTKADGELGTLIMSLRQNFRKLAIFVNVGQYPNLKPAKRQQLFIDFLGALHPMEVKLVCAIKDKQWPFANLTPELIAEAFPKFTASWGTALTLKPQPAAEAKAPAKRSAKKAT